MERGNHAHLKAHALSLKPGTKGDEIKVNGQVTAETKEFLIATLRSLRVRLARAASVENRSRLDLGAACSRMKFTTFVRGARLVKTNIQNEQRVEK